MLIGYEEAYRNFELIKKAARSLFDELEEMNERILSGKPSVFSAATLLLCVFNLEYALNPIEEYSRRYRELLYISNNTKSYYFERLIPKRSGGQRRLLIPDWKLACLQSVIKDCVLVTYPISERAFAYRKGVSVKDNACEHMGKEYVVKIDIKDFFDHISYRRVYNALAKAPDYSKDFITLVANLCCVEGHIPQGACTSPVLSNICFLNVDEAIVRYCKKHGIVYSRYCDDLTFSGDFVNPYKLVSDIYCLLNAFGYKPNRDKTSIGHRGQRMDVTGITTNEKLRVNKDYRKKIRQDIYYIKKYGVRSHILHSNAKEFISNGRCKRKKYLMSLMGRVQYALFIDPTDREMQEYSEYLKRRI